MTIGLFFFFYDEANLKKKNGNPISAFGETYVFGVFMSLPTTTIFAPPAVKLYVRLRLIVVDVLSC